MIQVGCYPKSTLGKEAARIRDQSRNFAKIDILTSKQEFDFVLFFCLNQMLSAIYFQSFSEKVYFYISSVWPVYLGSVSVLRTCDLMFHGNKYSPSKNRIRNMIPSSLGLHSE